MMTVHPIGMNFCTALGDLFLHAQIKMKKKDQKIKFED